MTRIFLVFVLTFLAIPWTAEASKNGVIQTDNSYVVGITFKYSGIDELCSGALISPTVIVTAAHCVFDENGNTGTNYQFSIPRKSLEDPIDPNIIPPKLLKVFTSPSLITSGQKKSDDIAFIQLDKPLATTGFIRVATSVDLSSLTSASPIFGYGFGAVYETKSSYSSYPRKYPIDWNSISFTPNSSTIELTSRTATPCTGDSGGPIVATLANGQDVIVGIISGASSVINGCGNQESDNNYHIRITVAIPYMSLVNSVLNQVVPSPTPLAKKITITCIKGKIIKKITALNPKCPTGYRKK